MPLRGPVMLLLLTLMIVCPAVFVNVLCRTAHAALLLALRPNPCTLVRALSTRPPVALANSLRLWRAAFRRTALSVVSDPAALSARYRFFHLRTFRSRARCIWLTSYWVYSLPLYSMFRAFSSCRLSSVQVGGSPSSGNTAKRCGGSSSRKAQRRFRSRWPAQSPGNACPGSPQPRPDGSADPATRRDWGGHHRGRWSQRTPRSCRPCGLPAACLRSG